MRRVDWFFLFLIMFGGIGTGLTMRFANDNRIYADVEKNQLQLETFIGTVKKASSNDFQLKVENKTYSLATDNGTLNLSFFENKKVKILVDRKNSHLIIKSIDLVP